MGPAMAWDTNSQDTPKDKESKTHKEVASATAPALLSHSKGFVQVSVRLPMFDRPSRR